MQNDNLNRQTFSTKDFPLSVFLNCKGFALVDIKKTSPKQAVFIFQDRPDRPNLVSLFDFGQEDDPAVMLDARKIITCVHQLKRKLYQHL